MAHFVSVKEKELILLTNVSVNLNFYYMLSFCFSYEWKLHFCFSIYKNCSIELRQLFVFIDLWKEKKYEIDG